MMKAKQARDDPGKRMAALRQEIHEIGAADRAYWAKTDPSSAEKAAYASRQERLERVRDELYALENNLPS